MRHKLFLSVYKKNNSETSDPGLTKIGHANLHCREIIVKQVSYRWLENCGSKLRHKLLLTDQLSIGCTRVISLVWGILSVTSQRNLSRNSCSICVLCKKPYNVMLRNIDLKLIVHKCHWTYNVIPVSLYSSYSPISHLDQLIFLFLHLPVASFKFL